MRLIKKELLWRWKLRNASLMMCDNMLVGLFISKMIFFQNSCNLYLWHDRNSLPAATRQGIYKLKSSENGMEQAIICRSILVLFCTIKVGLSSVPFVSSTEAIIASEQIIFDRKPK